METGDLVLFCDGTSFVSRIVELFTYSTYSHVALVIKDPYIVFKNCPECKDKKGIWILESGLEHPNFLGVQLFPLEQRKGKYITRKLVPTVPLNVSKLEDLYKKVIHKKYDFIDLIRCELGIPIGFQKRTSAFFCSSLIAYVYTCLGFLNPNVDWELYQPKSFSSKYLNELWNGSGKLT